MALLIVDDEEIALTSVRRLLRRRGYRDVDMCGEGRSAIEMIRKGGYDLVLLDLLMPGTTGMQVLEETRAFAPATEFIILTAVDEVASAVKAIRLGAFDYLVKPVANDRLLLAVERAYERRAMRCGMGRKCREAGGIPEAFADILTDCPRMKELIAFACLMVQSANPFLITGQSGTGKELMARGIHRASPVADGPYITVNMAAVPESMFESQFFGYVQGAFTGASKDYAGFFEQANGGTLFLDEIGEIPLHLQSTFLRILEEKTVQRLGDAHRIPLDVCIISATNKDLNKACQEGRFRLDLLYRLNSVHINLPPLKERGGDISLLADAFLKRYRQLYQKDIGGFHPEVKEVLATKEYPGNIRELDRLIEKAVLLCDNHLISPLHLGEDTVSTTSCTGRSLCTLKEDTEKHILYVLQQTKGDRKQAARILGISVRQVQRRIVEMRENPAFRKLLDDI